MSERDVKDENEILETEDKRVYELGYLLMPTIPEEDIRVVYGNLKELVSSLDGVAISDEMPKMIPLAYTMQKVINNVRSKFNTAYFGWLKFFMSPTKILELKKKLDLYPDLIRFLIFKTVKENTIISRRFAGRDMMHRRAPSMRKDGENEEIIPINKEEIDKEIDAMVAI